jgi:hypothetical protein
MEMFFNLFQRAFVTVVDYSIVVVVVIRTFVHVVTTRLLRLGIVGCTA